MGCGKSKHDVVTGNTTKIRKPSEAESVKGKESETIKRQESCRCRKTNDISAVVSGDQLETTVENNAKKPEEKIDAGDCVEKTEGEMMTNDGKLEEEETITISSPVTEIVPENFVTEETVDVIESVSPDEEQNENTYIETLVEEEKSVADGNDVDDDTKVLSPHLEEPALDVETTIPTESEAQENSTTENEEIAVMVNDEIAATENEEIAAIVNDEVEATENEEISAMVNEEIAAIVNDEVEAAENEEIAAMVNDEVEATENEEIPVLKDEDNVDALEENPADITKEVESA